MPIPAPPIPEAQRLYQGGQFLDHAHVAYLDWLSKRVTAIEAGGSVGPAGPQGPAGPAGPTGPQGAAGTGITMKGTVATVGALPPTGNVQGDSYIVSANGHLYTWNGSTWIDMGVIQGPPGSTGPQGPVGPTGATGPAGAAGATGAQGPTGLTGPQGPQGIPGPTGTIGATGPQGPQGPPGSTGATGPQGPAGPSGTTPDLAPYQTRVEKGAVNGYAPLDANQKVPLANLPPQGGMLTKIWGPGEYTASSIDLPCLPNQVQGVLLVGRVATAYADGPKDIYLRVNGIASGSYEYQGFDFQGQGIGGAGLNAWEGFDQTQAPWGFTDGTWEGSPFEIMIPDSIDPFSGHGGFSRCTCFQNPGAGGMRYRQGSFLNRNAGAALNTLTLFRLDGGNVTVRATLYGYLL